MPTVSSEQRAIMSALQDYVMEQHFDSLADKEDTMIDSETDRQQVIRKYERMAIADDIADSE